MITFERVKNTSKEIWWVARRGDNQVGLITKYRNTWTERHPYKVFIGGPEDIKIADFCATRPQAERKLEELVQAKEWRAFRDTDAGKAFRAARDYAVNLKP